MIGWIIGIIIGIILLLVILAFFGLLFYGVFRLWYYVLKSPDPFPGLTSWRALWVLFFTSKRR